MRDEAEIWAEYIRTKDINLRNELVERHINFSYYVANRIKFRVPEHQSVEDIVQYAGLGLIDAVEKFDPNMGCKFPTYAVRRIRGAILDGLRKEDPLPRAARKRVKDMEKAAAVLYDEMGREPTQAELAEELEISEIELGFVYRDAMTEHLSTDYDDFDVQDSRYGDPELEAQLLEVCETLAERLAAMDERERTFAYAHYAKGLNLTKIGDIVNVNESRIGQIRADVIKGITDSNRE